MVRLLSWASRLIYDVGLLCTVERIGALSTANTVVTKDVLILYLMVVSNGDIGRVRPFYLRLKELIASINGFPHLILHCPYCSIFKPFDMVRSVLHLLVWWLNSTIATPNATGFIHSKLVLLPPVSLMSVLQQSVGQSTSRCQNAKTPTAFLLPSHHWVSKFISSARWAWFFRTTSPTCICPTGGWIDTLWHTQ